MWKGVKPAPRDGRVALGFSCAWLSDGPNNREPDGPVGPLPGY